MMERLTKYVTPVGMVMTSLNSMKHYMPCVPCRHRAEIKYKNGKGYTEEFSFCGTCEVKMLFNKLKKYEDLEEQGLLLRLPCKVGDTVYCICERYTKCSEYGQVLEEYSCQGCECLECDSHKELYVQSRKVYSLDWIVSNLKRFGKSVFLTKAEAEQKLKEMESD